ncbi:hypothetical protein [Thermococcus waiotapuensis]|uniref:Uncharacterized protein n=1 Tax=Thermococcus waiotapuensis TaxID=90909 RepID=A0AAE4T3B1_9EURY|nr:hypothetical protein [Thermococcus waiotapuensis]MDV3103643.1 hypothetical protein [Thermococcus waiotapuensis]
MRQKMLWFVLGVLVGSLFVVSAYPQGSNSSTDSVSGVHLTNRDVPTVLTGLKNGNFEVVDSQLLKTLVDTRVIPCAPIFENNTLYAVKILPDGKFFIYAGTNIKDVDKFLDDARREFSRVDWNREVILEVEPSEFSWQVKVNGEPTEIYPPMATTTVSAYIEGILEWNSYDNWKPYGRLKLEWEVYRLADVDPSNDYRVVDMKTYVWSGYYLYGDSWKIDKVKVYANVKPDGNSVFGLVDFGPSHNVDAYNSNTQSTISYTLGTGGASIAIDQVIKLFKITVDTNGDWVRWTYEFNRNGESYADGWVKLEPGYQFVTHVPSSPTTAHQKLEASIETVYPHLLWFDDHWTGSVSIDWIWSIG